jgi:hypothetical protein
MCRDQEGCAILAYRLGVLSETIRNGSKIIGIVVMLGVEGYGAVVLSSNAAQPDAARTKYPTISRGGCLRCEWQRWGGGGADWLQHDRTRCMCPKRACREA